MVVIPVELLLDTTEIKVFSVCIKYDRVVLEVQGVTAFCPCPTCKTISARVHSYYRRTIQDLSWAGRRAELQLRARKFYGGVESCPRKVFTERLHALVKPYRRRTDRVDTLIAQFVLRVGGNAGTALARSIGIPVSASTGLRLAVRGELPAVSTPRILGIDDWAFKRGHHYGTILVDLEKRQPIDLLPDREAETVRTWLSEHPGIEIISRDRGGEYAKGCRDGAPDAQQVVDRWHLLKNLGDAFHRLLNKYNRELRETAIQIAQAKEVSVENNALERLPSQTASVSEQEAPSNYRLKFEAVKQLQQEGGHSLKSMVRQLGSHRHTIKKYLQYDSYPEKKAAVGPASSVDPYDAVVQEHWQAGERNHTKLFAIIQAQGYTGSLASLYRFTRHLPQDKPSSDQPKVRSLPIKVWSSRKAAISLNKPSKNWTEEEKTYLQTFLKLCPEAQTARKLVRSFHQHLTNRHVDKLEPWLAEALDSNLEELKNFARGLRQDYEAVKLAFTLPWSNGQVEGQVNRLKMLKRQMYGRAGFKLLRRRILFRSG